MLARRVRFLLQGPRALVKIFGRMRWWHAAGLYAVLLLAITAISRAARSPSVSPIAVTAPSLSPAVPTSAPVTRPRTSAARTDRAVRPTRYQAHRSARPTRHRAHRSGRSTSGGPGPGRLRVVGPGMVLRDPNLTPGAEPGSAPVEHPLDDLRVWLHLHDPAVVDVYDRVEDPQLGAGSTFHGDTNTGDYEEDHLISLELGGSADSVNNLWPEPYNAHEGAYVKDQIENKLHELICAGVLSLRTAQRAIADNWWGAYQHYIGQPAPQPRTSTRTHTRLPPPPPPVSHSCTTTSSGSCIRGGEFCPQASYGATGHDADGTAYLCTGDRTHPHWE